MAVEDHLLGQQVRCPHCQQILVAPAAVGSSQPETASPGARPVQAPASSDLASIPGEVESSSVGPPIHEEESIFSPTTHGSEDLFGVQTQGSVVEMPLEPVGQLPLPTSSNEIASSEPTAPPRGEILPTETLTPPAPTPDELEPAAFSPTDGEWPVIDSPGPAVDLPPEMATKPDFTRQVARRAKRESLFTTYLIIILIPYAIFATCVAAYFYWRMMQMPHPMEFLRDTGENPPAKRGASIQEMLSPETSLPPRLRVGLGQTMRIGDLEVVPQKVERRKITICYENSRLSPQITSSDALVLTLRLRNVSSDVLFTPTDPTFDRQWKREFGSNRPYTLLDMGGSLFFGGPIKWKPRTNPGKSRADDPRELVKGQEHDNQVLKPGEERTAIFCTDPDNREILQTLRSYQGPLVWRVQLRRGLVQVGEREVSATAVVGVVFDKIDIIELSSKQ
jgi:hypothetical protein